MKSEEGRGSRAENKMGRSLKTDDRDFENTGWEGRRKRCNISMLVKFILFPDTRSIQGYRDGLKYGSQVL